MGYYLIPPKPTQQEVAKLLVVTALMRFQQKHTVEVPPTYEVNFTKRTVKISAGETETYTFEQLGFT